MSQNPENVNGGLDPQLGGDRVPVFLKNIHEYVQAAKSTVLTFQERKEAIEQVRDVCITALPRSAEAAQPYMTLLYDLVEDEEVKVAGAAARSLLTAFGYGPQAAEARDIRSAQYVAEIFGRSCGWIFEYETSDAVRRRSFAAMDFDAISDPLFNVIQRLVSKHYPLKALGLLTLAPHYENIRSSRRLTDLATKSLKQNLLKTLVESMRPSGLDEQRRLMLALTNVARNYRDTAVQSACIEKLNDMAGRRENTLIESIIRHEATLALLALELESMEGK